MSMFDKAMAWIVGTLAVLFLVGLPVVILYQTFFVWVAGSDYQFGIATFWTLVILDAGVALYSFKTWQKEDARE